MSIIGVRIDGRLIHGQVEFMGDKIEYFQNYGR